MIVYQEHQRPDILLPSLAQLSSADFLTGVDVVDFLLDSA